MVASNAIFSPLAGVIKLMYCCRQSLGGTVSYTVDSNALSNDYFGEMVTNLTECGGGTFWITMVPRPHRRGRFTTGNPALDDYAGDELLSIVVDTTPFNANKVWVTRSSDLGLLQIADVTLEINCVQNGTVIKRSVTADSITITTNGDVYVSLTPPPLNVLQRLAENDNNGRVRIKYRSGNGSLQEFVLDRTAYASGTFPQIIRQMNDAGYGYIRVGIVPRHGDHAKQSTTGNVEFDDVVNGTLLYVEVDCDFHPEKVIVADIAGIHTLRFVDVTAFVKCSRGDREIGDFVNLTDLTVGTNGSVALTLDGEAILR